MTMDLDDNVFVSPNGDLSVPRGSVEYKSTLLNFSGMTPVVSQSLTRILLSTYQPRSECRINQSLNIHANGFFIVRVDLMKHD